MGRTDLIFLILIALFSAWQVFVLVRARRGIRMKTESPGRMGGIVLCLAIMAFAVWRRGNFASSWPVYAGLLVMLALYMLAPVGLSDKGLYSTTRFIPYGDLAYYAFEQESAPKCRLRLGRSGGRETVMSITQAQKPQAEAWLLAAGVDTFEAYGDTVRSRRL
jgi:hypothetical protein